MLTFTKHPILDAKAPTDEEIVALATGSQEDKEILKRWHKQHEARIRLAEEDPLNHGFSLEHWEYAEEGLGNSLSIMCLGGNRCYDAESTWIYDPIAKRSILASEIKDDFHCLALDGNGHLRVAPASKPFLKGVEDMIQINFEDGTSVKVTPDHRFLDFDLTEIRAGDVSVGDYLPSLSQFQDYIHASYGRIDSQKPEDSQQSCLSDLHQCDGQPQHSKASDQASSRQQVCAQEHTLESHNSDDPSLILSCIHDSSLSHSSESLTASQSVERPHHNSKEKCQVHGQQQQSSCLCQSSTEVARCDNPSIDSQPCAESVLDAQQQSFEQPSESCRCGQQSLDSLDPQNEGSELDHNRIFCDLPCSEYKRVVSIVSSPNVKVYDHSVWKYENYLANGCIHANSGKTEFGARTVVKAAIENPDSIIVCFAQDEDASVRVQQSAVYRNLPPKFKKKTKSETEYINYSVKNGFTGGSLILPNGSQILFHKYSQFIANRAKFEGLELGSKNPTWHNIGLWLDEYLEDGDLVETMRFRLATRNSIMMQTWTPIDGHTPFVASYLQDAQTTRTRPAELLGGEEVPLTQFSRKKNCTIIYFHSELNPFGGYDRIKKELAHSSREEILTRAYGIPVKSMTTLFPLFNTSVHVRDDLPSDLGDKSKWTVYHVVDPASARNYVSIWAAVNEKREVVVLREWPDRDTYGPWAEFGDPKWKFGPASKKAGYNVQGYVDLFKEIEHDLGVEVGLGCRIGDSRFFAAENEENVDLFTSFSECGMDFVPSDGRHEDVGITKLDEYFHYNPNVEVDVANKPLMTIHKDCGNTIYSIMNYGQNGKKDEPLKDFIDIPRYLVLANGGEGPMHFGPNSLKQKAQGGAY